MSELTLQIKGILVSPEMFAVHHSVLGREAEWRMRQTHLAKEMQRETV
jgi:hypothetical protein